MPSRPLLLNRNENTYGPSPKALKAIHQFPKEHASMYLEGYYQSRLVEEISKQFKIAKDKIILNYGTEDFIRSLFSILNPQKDLILTNQLSFPYFESFAKFKGLKLILFNLKKDNHAFYSDIGDCISKIKLHRPKIIIITTPNNPTGHLTPFSDIKRIIKTAPRNSLLLVDETYVDFYPGYRERDLKLFIKKYPNIAFLRTFSKFYGLAGLRIGFGFCGKNFKKAIGYEERFLGFSRILEEAGVAALRSKNFYKEAARKICRDRDWFVGELKHLKNFQVYQSLGSFVMVELSPKALQKFKAQESSRKVVIWKWINKNSFRVSIGKTSHLKDFTFWLKSIESQIAL